MFLFIILLASICGILYQLIIGTISSYLIGNSVLQFSLTIGLFMTGMGIGAYISRFFKKNPIQNFLIIELLLSILGASILLILKGSYIYFGDYYTIFYFIYILLTTTIGALIGAEIPIMVEIFEKLKLKSTSVISDIFTFDYIGALIASLVFPLILLPLLGVHITTVFTGILNLLAGVLFIKEAKKHGICLKNFHKYVALTLFFFISLIFIGNKVENIFLQSFYKEPIIYTKTTQYQDIVVTKRGDDIRLYLNGNIQFMSLDEGRYHEALVKWPIDLINKDNLDILVLGGGDGLAVRDILETGKAKNITLVELDPEMIKISKEQSDLKKLNKGSLDSDNLTIINEDAFNFIRKTDKKYDLIIADFPDPKDTHTSKLYSKELYASIYGTLKNEGVFITQASNSFFATKAFFSIDKTINSVFGNSIPYHRYLPSFGDWGFVLAQKGGLKHKEICPELGCDKFDKWYKVEDIKENTLTEPVIIKYYEDGYRKFNL